MSKVEIPKGWRRLKSGEVRRAGDKLSFKAEANWALLTDSNVGTKQEFPSALITIRRIPSKRKARK